MGFEAQRLVDTDFGVYLGACRCIILSGRRKSLICIGVSDMNAPNGSQNAPSEPGLLDQLRDRTRLKQHSIRTESHYVHCAKQDILFHQKRHPRDMGAADVEAFLTHLAVEGNVAAPTQKQALSALLFLRTLRGHPHLGVTSFHLPLIKSAHDFESKWPGHRGSTCSQLKDAPLAARPAGAKG